jgi:hypothetical protein
MSEVVVIPLSEEIASMSPIAPGRPNPAGSQPLQDAADSSVTTVRGASSEKIGGTQRVTTAREGDKVGPSAALGTLMRGSMSRLLTRFMA